MVRFGFAFAAITVVATTFAAQTPAFEVTSVKPVQGVNTATMIAIQPGGRFVATGVGVGVLIQYAYDVESFQVEGVPDSLARIAFDVTALAPATSVPPTPVEMKAMLRTLLAQRFKLVATTQQQPRPIYALRTARDDRRLGLLLQPSVVDCSTATGVVMRPVPDGAIGPSWACGVRTGQGMLTGGNMTMQTLGEWLSQMVRRPVVDETHLEGRWNVDLAFNPPSRSAAIDPAQAVAPERPELFTAIREQLGLKLESTTGPVEVLVIESVEHPTPD